MVYFNGYDIGTAVSTILQTPPNYSFRIDKMYVSNASTIAGANDTASLMAFTTKEGTVTGTTVIGIVSQAAGGQPYSDDLVERVPANAYLVAFSAQGNIKLTIGGTYIYYRE